MKRGNRVREEDRGGRGGTKHKVERGRETWEIELN